MKYPETHKHGSLSIEKELRRGARICDLGVQIAEDGRIWICVNGESVLRFKPLPKPQESEKEDK